MVKNLPAMQETQVQSLGREGPLEKEWLPTPVFSAWRIPWTKEPGGLQSMGSQSVRHDLAINTLTFCFIYPQKTYQERKQVRFGYICH